MGNINVIANNERVLEQLDAINSFRVRSNKKPAYENILGKHPPYGEKVRYIQLLASLTPPMKRLELSRETYLKIRFFHNYSVYLSLNADYAFFKRVCSGQDEFSSLFASELSVLQQNFKQSGLSEDSQYVMSRLGARKTESHLCFVPLRGEGLDLGLVEDLVMRYRGLIKAGFNGEFGTREKQTGTVEELRGCMVQTHYNRGKYVLLGKSQDTLESIMYWDDRKRRKRWKVRYWNYYKIRYGIELSINGDMAVAVPAGSALDRRVSQAENCYQHFAYELHSRKKEDAEAYLAKLASHYVPEKRKLLLIPTELCQVHPFPVELYELIKNTPVILSAFNNITLFKSFKDSTFFSSVYVSPTAGNRLGFPLDPKTQVPLSNLIKLHFLAEALTSGSANVSIFP